MSIEEETTTTPFPQEPTAAAPAAAPAADGDAQPASDAAPTKTLKEPEGDPPVIPYVVQENVRVIHDPFDMKPPKPGTFAVYERLSILGVQASEAAKLSEHYPEVELGESDAEQTWTETSVEGAKHSLQFGTYEQAMARANSLWTNSVEAEKERLHISRPTFEKNDGMKLSGQQAVMRMQSLTGMGTHARIPLWHTGIWVTMRAPTEAALLELERRLGHEKIRFGRETGGLMFSNTMVYLMNSLVDFALEHIIEATVAHVAIEDLKEIILLPDAHSLIHGILCTMYPNGYPYRQPCVINPFKCTHVIEANISIPRLAFTDQLRLTEWQARQMTRKFSKFTADELKKYQEQHTYLAEREVKLTDQVSMTLCTPTIEKYRQVGTSWIDSLVSRVTRSFGANIEEGHRAQLISEQGRITSLCQYAHMVQKITLVDRDAERKIITNVIEDTPSIVDSLSALTASAEIFQAYYDGMNKFIEASVLTIMAVPKTPCPVCSKDHVNDEKYKAQPSLIPLDIVNIFFTLRARRITKTLHLGNT